MQTRITLGTEYLKELSTRDPKRRNAVSKS